MEIAIIGGGIVGVTAALSLAEAGAEVTLVERGDIAGAASGLNAGVIGGGGWGSAPDVETCLKMGSRERYLELADVRNREFGLERTGTLTMVRTEAELAWARGHVEQSRAGGGILELVTADELAELEPAADRSLLGAIFDPLSCRAEPVAATKAFADEAVAAGTRIRVGCAVVGLRATASGFELTLDDDGQRERIGADVVVVAAGPWCAEIGAMVGVEVPIVAVRGQMWASAPQPPLLRHAIAAVESPLAWQDEAPPDGEPPYLTHRAGRRTTRHLYGRQRANGEIVFGGDRVLSDDRTVDDDGIAVNHAHVAELLPAIGTLAPRRTWAGSMPFSLDGRPLIGPIPGRDGLFLAGGLASSGFGRGPMTGRLVADMVLGRTIDIDMQPVLPDGRAIVHT